MKAPSTFKLMAFVFLAVLQFSSFSVARPVHPNARQAVQITDFYKALAPYGTWVNHRTYGKVWYPNGVDENWRPYTDGYWAHTDEYGWLWVANEAWGWAPYHYGRWAWDKWYGWIWVPGNTWAPAWVLWRSGGGYVAWAPMPPNVVWQPNQGLNTRYFDYDRDMFVGSWVAVHDYDFPNRYLSRRVFTPRHTIQIFHTTNYIYNPIIIINRTIVNKGVPIRHIEKAIGKPIHPVKPIVVHDIDPPSTSTKTHDLGVPTIVQPNVIMAGGADANKEIELAQKLKTNLSEANAPTPGADDTQPRIPGRLSGGPEPSPVQAMVPPTTPDNSNLQSTQPIGQALTNNPQNPITVEAPLPSATSPIASEPTDKPAIIQADPNAPCPVGTNCIPQSGQIPIPADVAIPSAVVPELPMQTPTTGSPATVEAVPNPIPAETLSPALDNTLVPTQQAVPPADSPITQPVTTGLEPENATTITPSNQFDGGAPVPAQMPAETQSPTTVSTPEPINPSNTQEPLPVYQQEMAPSEPVNIPANNTPSENTLKQFDSAPAPEQSPMPVETPQPAVIETNPEPPPPSSASEPAPTYQPEPTPEPQPEPVAPPAPQPEPMPQPQAQPEPPPAPTPEPAPPVQETPPPAVDKKDEKPAQN